MELQYSQMEVDLHNVPNSCLIFSSILKEKDIDNKENIINKAMVLLKKDKNKLNLYIPYNKYNP